MKKADRQKIFEKFGGRCAYCGCELQKGWHVDEIEPIIRGAKYHYQEDGTRIREKYITHPERININNQNPACPSCNIQKHQQSLEDFRKQISQFIESLNKYHSIYRFAKRYGLVHETGVEVKFYFELITKEPENKNSNDEQEPQIDNEWLSKWAMDKLIELGKQFNTQKSKGRTIAFINGLMEGYKCGAKK